MDLLKSFPEIDSFFKNSQFSQTKLIKLVEEINIKYKDRKELEAALSLIKLELLKFEIQTINSSKEKQPVNIKENNINRSKNRIEKPKKEKHLKKKLSKDLGELPKDFPRKISDISLILDFPLDYLIRILRQNSIIIEAHNPLNEDELLKIKPFLLSRINALRRHERKGKYTIAKSGRFFDVQANYCRDENHKTIGVYNEISKYGIGKVIYIKSK